MFKTGPSLLSYVSGFTIFLDGEPKDSLLKPVTKVMIGVAAMTAVAAVLLKEAKMPEWLKTSRLGNLNFPPWVLACMIIVFMRLRKRTKDAMKILAGLHEVVRKRVLGGWNPKYTRSFSHGGNRY